MEEEEKVQELQEKQKGPKEVTEQFKQGNIKEAVRELEKSKQRKRWRRRIIIAIIIFLSILLIAASFYSIINAEKTKMINMSSNIGVGSNSSAFEFFENLWRKITKKGDSENKVEYWVDLNKKTKFILDAKTGENLAYIDENTNEPVIIDRELLAELSKTKRAGRSIESLTQTEIIELTKEFLKTKKTVEKEYTLVDNYVKELGNQGVSIKALRLLGNADYTDMDKLLGDEENKKQVEKYISEFIRADIITQQPHRRLGNELIDPNDQNHVDGGVYFWRAKEEKSMSENDFESLEEGEKKSSYDTTYTDYMEMTYVPPKDFLAELGYSEDTSFATILDITRAPIVITNKEKMDRLKYIFTEDPLTQEVVFLEFDSEEKISVSTSNKLDKIQETVNDARKNGSLSSTYYVRPVSRSYKEMIAKYTMPYEFLINLCEITANPEFVYHVALLARDTQIVLVVQDNEVINRETDDKLTYYDRYYSDVSPMDYSNKTEEWQEGQREITITTERTLSLQKRFAESWSFYEEFIYSRDLECKTLAEENWEEKFQYQMLGEYTSSDGVGKYYQGSFPVKRDNWHQTKSAELTYNEITVAEINAENLLQEEYYGPVEKRKQFLGLLRNTEGKCPIDCYQEYSEKEDPEALECVKKAEGNKNGNNVLYRIPNMTRKESPLNMLKSGIKILYAMLGSNTSGSKGSEDESLQKYESEYVEKMQFIIEHMKFLMQFPENEGHVIKHVEPDYPDAYTPIRKDDEENADEDLLSAAEWVHKYVREHGYTYAKAGVSLPNYNTKTIDCSSYVTWVVLHTGYRSSRFYEGMHQWTDRTFYQNSEGWQEISSFANALQGDILVYNGHVEIYAGGGTDAGGHAYVFNCGGNTSINYKEAGYSGHKTSSIQKILRINGGSKGSTTVEAKYGLTAQQLDVLYAVVAQECSANYEGALAVITCILNRCVSPAWQWSGGNDPYKQATYSGQFCYSIDNYWKKYLNGKAPGYVIQAVNDALENGKRNHSYLSFRTDSDVTRRNHPDGKNIGGNWYF